MEVKKVMNNHHVPILIIVICASINMLAQTIASTAKIMGYDKVIEADAQARKQRILGTTSNHQLTSINNKLMVLQKELVTQKVDNIIRFEKLEKYSHAKSNKK